MGSKATYPLLPGLPAAPTSKGGRPPPPPFATDAFRVTIRRAPTKAEIFDILRRVTEPSYHIPIIDDPRGSVALYRQMSCQMTAVADGAFRSQQAAFYLTYPTQGDVPASSLTAATMTVDLQRSKNRDVNLTAEIGTIILFGPHGRTYINSERVVWAPFGATDLKSVEFVSQNPGYVGNLAFLADANGLLTNPDGTAATAIVGLQTQGGTTNIFADITNGGGVLSTITDQGKPDVFSEADVGLYVEILTSTASPTNVGRLMRIVGYDSNGTVNSILVDDGPQQTQIFAALAYVDVGAVFTNETAAARDEVIDDMTLMPAAPAVVDSYYFGSKNKFASLEITISTPGVGDWVITWKYWDGNNYVPLPGVIDNSVGFTAGGTTTVSWTVPADWIVDTQDGIAAFYVNAEVTTFTSITTQPLGKIAYVFDIDQLTVEANDEATSATGAVEWVIRDWIALGIEIIQIEAPTGGRDNTLRLLGDERGVFQQDGETDDVFRNRAARLADVVSPNAILNTVNRALAPFGFTGKAIDVMRGGTFESFDGWFWDTDAWDYYENNVVSHAVADDGGVGTDETAEAQSDTVDDMTLLPATAATSDRYFFGQTEPYSELQLDITTPGVGDWVIEWRYFNGSISVALSDVVDNTNAFKNVGIRTVTWTVPGDWATETQFSVGPAFFVEARVTSVTTTTTQPLGRQAKTAFKFPKSDNAYKLFLSGRTGDPLDEQFGEAYGWFFIILPCLPSLLDFGFAWDLNEPANVLDGQTLATAWDVMVWDGEPTDANAAYAGIADSVNRIRAGGVGFTIIRDCDLNVPICP